jgi:hypothetical protein
VTGFLARHQQLTVRSGNIIIRSRAAITQKDVLDFFKRFMKSAEGLPPETSTTVMKPTLAMILELQTPSSDVDSNMQSTKTCISIMFYGTAAGEMLPSYFVYKIGKNIMELTGINNYGQYATPPPPPTLVE